jgi:hypothetical protein
VTKHEIGLELLARWINFITFTSGDTLSLVGPRVSLFLALGPLLSFELKYNVIPAPNIHSSGENIAHKPPQSEWILLLTVNVCFSAFSLAHLHRRHTSGSLFKAPLRAGIFSPRLIYSLLCYSTCNALLDWGKISFVRSYRMNEFLPWLSTHPFRRIF